MTGFFFVHGWGFDAGIWKDVHAALGHPPAAFANLGYFGGAVWPEAAGPVIAVGHSLGAMRLLRKLPENCLGLIALNGFERFAAGRDDGAGVPRRVVGRMIARFKAAPGAVLADFRQRCGTDEAAPGGAVQARLLADLELLLDGDERMAALHLPCPVLALHGAEDAILPPGMRAAVFAGAECATLAGHGHLLPLSAPEWCAARIAAFASRIGR